MRVRVRGYVVFVSKCADTSEWKSLFYLSAIDEYDVSQPRKPSSQLHRRNIYSKISTFSNNSRYFWIPQPQPHHNHLHLQHHMNVWKRHYKPFVWDLLFFHCLNGWGGSFWVLVYIRKKTFHSILNICRSQWNT